MEGRLDFLLGLYFVIMFWLNENEPMVNFTQYTKWPGWCTDIIRSEMQVTGKVNIFCPKVR